MTSLVPSCLVRGDRRRGDVRVDDEGFEALLLLALVDRRREPGVFPGVVLEPSSSLKASTRTTYTYGMLLSRPPRTTYATSYTSVFSSTLPRLALTLATPPSLLDPGNVRFATLTSVPAGMIPWLRSMRRFSTFPLAAVNSMISSSTSSYVS